MIPYTSMTVKQALDEVMIRIAKLNTSANMDYLLGLMYLNRARREVMAVSLPFKDYFYTKSGFAVSNGTELPQNFSGQVRVMLKDPGATDYTEARRVDAKEWWTLTNTVRPHSWNGANNTNPIYTIWGSDDSDTQAWSDKGLVIKVAPSTVVGYIDYYAEYGDLVNDTDTLNVPPEFENMVITMTIQRIFQKLGETSKAMDMYKTYQAGIMDIRKRAIAKRQTEGINLQSQTSNMPTNVQTVTNN